MDEKELNYNKNKRNWKGILLWFWITTLTITNAVTLWLLFNEREVVVKERIIREKTLVEKDNVESELYSLKADYAELKGSNAKMQEEIDAKKNRIDSLLKIAAKHKGDAYTISLLKKETETLREIMKGFVRTIDSLNTLNKTLVAEKKAVVKQLGTEKEKQQTLIKEKEELKTTIAKGSILSCFNISAKAVLYKRGGKKEVETTKARKAQKIKVSFSLSENKIAQSGEKSVYVRVMTPDGKEMAKEYNDIYKFTFNGSNGYYAGKTELNYANTEISGVIFCEGNGEMVSGNYMIEITCDGAVIGNTTLKLD